MDLKTAKELAHVKAWLDRMATIVRSGKDAYLTDIILQEAGDSLMMKLGEAAGRLKRLDAVAPDGVDWADAISNRNFLIHQYDEIDREISWVTLSRDLSEWRTALQPLLEKADAVIDAAPRDQL